MSEVQKIDSNVTGLRIAEESSLGVLPGSPIWYDLEPNSYADFGGNLALVARNPINPSRQRKKGVITDLDASGGFNQDLTFSNLAFLFPGLFLSTKREKFNRTSDGTGAGGPSPIESIGASNDVVFGADESANVNVGDLLFFTGFGVDGNNGLKRVTAVLTDTVTVNETLTAEATVPAGATVLHVGFQFTAGDAEIANTSGSLPTLTATTKDLTDFGLIAGETIFIGGDDTGASGDAFNAAHNNGFSRVSETPVAGTITLDKTSGGADGETEMATEAGGTKTIRVFFGSVLRNESAISSDFDRKSWTMERSLGIPNPQAAPSVVQSEVLKGAIVNEFALNIAQADKITTDWTFIGTDNEQRDGVTSGEERLSTTTGSVATIEAATAYNTSSDFSRIKLAEVRPTQTEANRAAPVPLFAYVTDITLNVSNNGTPNKAVGVLGGFDVTAGTFEVGGNITAYFADVAAVKAVRNNADITLDMAIVKDFGTGNENRKAGIFIDVPLIALGDGRANIAQDEAITLPLSTDAAEYEPFGHTLVYQEFEYLPSSADT
jgi:hypothetical protein